jgi:hypothetical protein
VENSKRVSNKKRKSKKQREETEKETQLLRQFMKRSKVSLSTAQNLQIDNPETIISPMVSEHHFDDE